MTVSSAVPTSSVSVPTSSSPEAGVFAAVVGQPQLVDALRAAAGAPVHAYLLIGGPGAGSRAAATAFSAALLCGEGGCGSCRDCRLALALEHPDAVHFVPDRASLLKDDAEEIIRLAVRSPVEGRRKVLVLHDFHRVGVAGPMLLKTVEEPPASTVFVILADSVPPELVTIASRCARLDVPPLADTTVERALVGEGVSPDQAVAVAGASLGDLDRARLLLVDPALADRRSMWARLPERLDGSGAAVAVAVEEVLLRIDDAAGPLREHHAVEVRELDERIARQGERGSGRKQLENQHRQQLRRHRATELRFGLATLARRYRDALVDAAAEEQAAIVAGLDAITRAAEALPRNPNEPLLLQALLLQVPPLPPGGDRTTA